MDAGCAAYSSAANIGGWVDAACSTTGSPPRRSRPGRRRTEDILFASFAAQPRGLHDAACELCRARVASGIGHRRGGIMAVASSRGAVAQPALRNTVRSAQRWLSCGDCARGPARLPGLLQAMVKAAMIRCGPGQSHGGSPSTAVTSHGSRTLAQPARGGRPGCGMGTGHDVFPSEAVM
jgi:hypothetical protein